MNFSHPRATNQTVEKIPKRRSREKMPKPCFRINRMSILNTSKSLSREKKLKLIKRWYWALLKNWKETRKSVWINSASFAKHLKRKSPENESEITRQLSRIALLHKMNELCNINVMNKKLQGNCRQSLYCTKLINFGTST